ncbi:MAG TPA: PKD domain-containing protein [Gemmatimonadales bacterium]|nr:PKD domain-containing protein [Gemmatimonadales bacterium]
MRSRTKYLLIAFAFGLACKQPAIVSPPAPPPSPPPPPPVPVARAGGPYSSTTGTVNFDGSASTDPSGSALTYSWSFGDSTKGSGMKPSHTYQGDGTYLVSLTVTNAANVSSNPATTTASVSHPQPSHVLVGAGNIATCGDTKDEATAALIAALPGAAVFTLGDNVFENGTDSEYVNCYGPSWGQFKDRTRPTLGNHDYANGIGKSDAAGSFDYFGAALGPTRGLGYYSYDVGTWHIVVLNDKGDTDPAQHGIDPAQLQWLSNDLDSHPAQCTIAMFHVGLFISSNTAGWTSNPAHKPIWDVLYAKGVDVVLNGQQHNYERFAPMTPDGVVDTVSGIREFNVGTGGEAVDVFTVIHPHSEARAAVFGVLKLTLKPSSYDWQFLPIAGQTYTDSGSGTCH